MFQQFPIAALIAQRRTELRGSSADIVRRAGYRSINGGLRRLDDLCHGDLTQKTRFLRDGLPGALELPPDQVQEAFEATQLQLDEEERARIEEEGRWYREQFKPHVIWVTEFDRPSSITMAAFYGIERLLRFDLDADLGEGTFVSQATAAMPSSVNFFGKVVGFYINFTPDRCVQHDREGNVVSTFVEPDEGSPQPFMRSSLSMLARSGAASQRNWRSLA
jgi:hypothetical protein